MKNGYQNEYDFVYLFNDKYIYELDNNSKKFINELFRCKVKEDEKLKSWKNRTNQKTDIFIKYKNYIKNISLKCGNSNSVHQESIEDFKMFLAKLEIPYDVIDYYTSYHYGYKKDENGKIDFSRCLSAEEYKQEKQYELDIFNNEINKTKLIILMVDRFIVRGRNSDYDIDVFVSGTVSDYVWISKDDLYDLILSKRYNDFTSPHIGPITIGPKKRNLNGDSKNSRERYVVCARWNFIREDIINFKNNKKDSV